MRISLFEALCLLPDGERFEVYKVFDKQGNAARYEISLEELDRVTNNHSYVLLGRNAKRRVGYLIFLGSKIWLKADKEKVERYLKQNKVKRADRYIIGYQQQAA